MANVKELNINSTTYDIIGKGVVDQNNTSTPLKEWSGTKAQYDALVSGETVDSNTIYNITDDSDGSLQNLFETIYPVGSIYMGTMNICPLSALLGTWTKIGTKILTDISGSNSVPVKGDGKTLGFTNGTSNVGINSYNSGSLRCYTGLYGQNIGTIDSGSIIDQRNAMGVTTDSTKSGIIADISNSLTKTSITVNIWQRTE